MLNNRRKFMLATGLAAGGVALSGLELIAGESSSARAEREVLAVIGRYGKSIKVKQDGGSTHHKVKMRCAEDFAKVFDPQGLPFEQIYVGEKNTLKFTHGGVDFTIANVA